MTEKVEMVLMLEEETILVRAWGGYDGYIEKVFDSPSSALEYVAYLWQH